MQMLNVGCGDHCDWRWVNLDLVAAAPGVIAHDLRKGLPFPNESFDAVYHSHVIEHLSREVAQQLLADCFRVLKPGGMIRVVVPDLESIVRHYLQALERRDRGESAAEADLNWMRLELLDQMTRSQPGGEMARWMQNPELANPEFVQSRMGHEFLKSSLPSQRSKRHAALSRKRLHKELEKARRVVALVVVFLLAGRRGYAALREGWFRQSGEVHRWMYDRVSLSQSLQEAGFDNLVLTTAWDSQIPEFAKYQLDVVDGRIRKPDSFFMEAMKPSIVAAGMPGARTVA